MIEPKAGVEGPNDKWAVQLRKGCLELAILASLWDGKRYGLEIQRLLERTSTLAVAEGTMYPLLARLRSLGLLTVEWVEAETGHPRKYYELTPAGRRRAQEMVQTWAQFASNLDAVLAPLAAKAS